MSKKDENFLEEEDFWGDEILNPYWEVTSSRIILKTFLEKHNSSRKNTFDWIDRTAKSALLWALKDWYGIRSNNDYKTLKKLLDESSIWITLPESIEVYFEWNSYTDYILLYKDNKTLVVNSKREEIWTIDRNWFMEAYYPSKIDIDLEAVFYR
jgi:hypothetical protein